jgi:hypothetical protein
MIRMSANLTTANLTMVNLTMVNLTMEHHRTDRAGEDPPETGAVPPSTAGQLPRQHEARLRTAPILKVLLGG